MPYILLLVFMYSVLFFVFCAVDIDDKTCRFRSILKRLNINQKSHAFLKLSAYYLDLAKAIFFIRDCFIVLEYTRFMIQTLRITVWIINVKRSSSNYFLVLT